MMLLRTAIVLFNGAQTSRGSLLCQLPRRNLLSPKCYQIRSNNSFRPAFRSKPRFGGRPAPPSVISPLKIPFIFTVTVGSASLLGNQYLGKIISQKSHDPTSFLSWWHSKPDWFKVYWLICGACIVVCSIYRVAILLETRVPAMFNFMETYFVLKPQSGSILSSTLPLLLSTYSHISPLHLGANMFILYNIAQTVVPEIGKEKFLGCYCFSSVVSAFVSLSYQTIKNRNMGSVGASGAILGLIGMTIVRHPEYQFYIIFLPFFAIPAPVACLSLATFDLLGVIRGWKFFDHAGHLGGLSSGLVWEFLNSFHAKFLQTKEKTEPVKKRGFW